ncbi:hypothetical protein [Rhodococcus sp. 11-3]|uniref:hypothetical protein n=1 Tax=Rhodococcus sp. 11-3 TaxID=2854796 RepID=UPI00203E9AB9|nr:hypothetical protein [Rhodococcus sp. 11-3]USC16998.1 hypothetical protein KZJ41_09090 [Rhodococcus sp. 11-3]
MTIHSLTDENFKEFRNLYVTCQLSDDTEMYTTAGRITCYRSFSDVAKHKHGILVDIRDTIFFRSIAEDRGQAAGPQTWTMRWMPEGRQVELLGGVGDGVTRTVGNPFNDEVTLTDKQTGRKHLYRIHGWNDQTRRWVHTEVTQ